MTRDQILQLGQAGDPWAFLPIALQALAQEPDDAGVRLLAAANAARLRLRTLACEQLDALPGQAADLDQVRSLRRALELMEPDRVPLPVLARTCRANLEALADRGPGLGAAFDRWAADTRRWEWFRTSDDRFIRRQPASNGDPPGPWIGLSDQLVPAITIDRQIAADPKIAERPVVLEGADPPWTVAALIRRHAQRKDLYRPHLTVVQLDPDEFFDGLSQVDLADLLRLTNVRAIVGPDAAQRLRSELAARIDFDITGPVVSLLSVRSRVTPGVAQIVNDLGREQQAMTEAVHAQVQSIYAGRTPEFWAQRFRAALSGQAEPLRVLVPTARNSTFVKHASADLVEAFRSIGLAAELLIEPDDSTRFAAPAYLRRFAEFKPDLVILINYPRAMLANAIPEGVPFICWLQDAMPHLFRAELGATFGPLDFLAGHLFDELFTKHGYPRSRALESAILASERKFHPTPIHDADRRRFECEIAYVSHQSETPEAQHARLRGEFADKFGLGRAIDRLGDIVRREHARPIAAFATMQASEWAAEVLREEMQREPDAALVDMVARAFIQPYADRVIRHETLQWAADAAEKHGWRFKLYGKGWNTHPRLAAFAAGELGHGDDLRGSYQAAAVHLHMTTHSLVHQRLIECVMSGGFPLCRLHVPELSEIATRFTRQGLAEGARAIPDPPPDHTPPEWTMLCWADAPSLMQYARLVQALNLNTVIHQFGHIGPVITSDMYNTWRQLPELRPEFSAFHLLGDQADFFFADAVTLEARVDRAINRPEARAALTDAARRRLASRYTYAVLARRMVEFVRDQLTHEAPAPGVATTRAGAPQRKDAA